MINKQKTLKNKIKIRRTIDQTLQNKKIRVNKKKKSQKKKNVSKNKRKKHKIVILNVMFARKNLRVNLNFLSTLMQLAML
jgi:hypothetical protein